MESLSLQTPNLFYSWSGDGQFWRKSSFLWRVLFHFRPYSLFHISGYSSAVGGGRGRVWPFPCGQNKRPVPGIQQSINCQLSATNQSYFSFCPHPHPLFIFYIATGCITIICCGIQMQDEGELASSKWETRITFVHTQKGVYTTEFILYHIFGCE